MSHIDNNNKVYINSKGERVMRVSEVIRRLAKSQLLIWANMLGFKGVSYKGELDRTANIGSLAHDVAEAYADPHKIAIIDYDAYNISDDISKKEATNAIESFVQWYKGMKKRFGKKFNILHTEYVVVGESLGGTIDCILEDWEDSSKVIFADYKTSGGFYLTQFLQLAAYVIIYEEIYGKNTVGGIMVVRLDKKHGKRAEAKLIRRKKLNLFMTMFESLFQVAICEDILNKNLNEICETIY